MLLCFALHHGYIALCAPFLFYLCSSVSVIAVRSFRATNYRDEAYAKVREKNESKGITPPLNGIKDAVYVDIYNISTKI